MTSMCSKWADGAPSAVLTVQPSAASTDSADPPEMTGSIAMTSPGLRGWSSQGNVVVVDGWIFMDRPAYAVAAKLGHHVESLALDFSLHRSSDQVYRSSCACALNGEL